MAPSFALVWFSDPPCSKVFRDDAFLFSLAPEDVGSEKTVRISVGKDKTIIVEGKVLEIGTKTNLILRRVNQNGTVVNKSTPDTLPHTYKLGLKAKAGRGEAARTQNLGALNSIIVTEGPGSLPTLKGTKRFSTPKPSYAELEILKEKILQLPCLQAEQDVTSWVKLSSGTVGIWIQKIDLSTLLLFNKSVSQASMFRSLIRLLIPDDILASPGLTSKAKDSSKTHASIPRHVITIAHRWAHTNTKRRPGDIKFDPVRSLENLIREMRQSAQATLQALAAAQSATVQAPAATQSAPTLSEPENTAHAGYMQSVAPSELQAVVNQDHQYYFGLQGPQAGNVEPQHYPAQSHTSNQSSGHPYGETGSNSGYHCSYYEEIGVSEVEVTSHNIVSSMNLY